MTQGPRREALCNAFETRIPLSTGCGPGDHVPDRQVLRQRQLHLHRCERVPSACIGIRTTPTTTVVSAAPSLTGTTPPPAPAGWSVRTTAVLLVQRLRTAHPPGSACRRPPASPPTIRPGSPVSVSSSRARATAERSALLAREPWALAPLVAPPRRPPVALRGQGDGAG